MDQLEQLPAVGTATGGKPIQFLSYAFFVLFVPFRGYSFSPFTFAERPASTLVNRFAADEHLPCGFDSEEIRQLSVILAIVNHKIRIFAWFQ